MSERKYNADQLDGYTMTSTDITCSVCKKTDTTFSEAMYAVDVFFERGWRATENRCYCPKCALGKLKNIK